MKKKHLKFAPKITGAKFLENEHGDVRISFSAPHNASVGAAFEGAGKMHTIVSVENKLTFTARPVKKPKLGERLKLAARIVIGQPKQKSPE